MQRLGKNLGKYCGETIDIQRVMDEMEAAAKTHGWSSEVFFEGNGQRLLAFTRKSTNPQKRIYISTGIHGDEPAGPLAMLKLLQANDWPAHADFWICPCLNPAGFLRNTRENPQGVDLNRQYRNTEAAETRAHIAWLEQQPNFDVCLCLHEDWESAGFYLYTINLGDQPSFSKKIIENVSQICPIDRATEIEGREAKDGIISPNLDPASRPLWPEALYLIMNKTQHSYTVEAPSDFPLETRVAAEIAAVRVVLDSQ